MSLSLGDRLGPYEILGPLGKGGMGEVYRAHDSRMGRDVAVKVSKDQFTERFAREVRAVAALNHPNVCTLHDVGPDYLVMELVDGPTLAERIAQGPMPLDEALGVARQIADALDAAHDKGIVHRDLKPGNVKIRADGTVKVLDFGLAKVGGAPNANLDNSPTMTAGETQAGVILGTAAYMSPEQAKGKAVDKRADIWAFGVVLYEMVTGRRLFEGETTTEVLASVLKEDPRWDHVPPQVQRLLRRCLEKDPQKRLRHIGDVMSLVDEAPPTLPAPPTARSPIPPALLTPPRNWRWPIAVAAGLVVTAVALAMWAPWRSKTNLQAVRFEVGPAEKMIFNVGGAMAVSPDGRWMAFPATSEDGVTRYWLRSLETVEARALPGSELSPLAPPVSWSWDSRYVLFGSGGKLLKVDIQGGPPQTIADIPGTFGMNGAGWNRDGVIVFATTPAVGQPLFRVAAAGGTPTPMTVLADGDTQHRWPQFLPDRKHFLYLRVTSDPNRTGVYVGSIDARPEEQPLERLLASDRQAYYAPSTTGGSGHLLFLRGSVLMAQPFDPDRRELTGEPAAIAESVDSFAQATYGLFSVSDTGALVYRQGNSAAMRLTWYNEQGVPGRTLGEPGVYDPAISPDGNRVAVVVGATGSARDIWIMDVARGTTTRFTFDKGTDESPVWSPDGRNIVFASNRGGQRDLYIKPADGSEEERPLLKSGEPKTPFAWSKDGHFLFYGSAAQKTGADIWALTIPSLEAGAPTGDAMPMQVVRTDFSETMPAISPDGHWLAYMSLESGAPEIYVRRFAPDANQGGSGGPKWMASRGAGVRPRWRADGKQLFYISPTAQLMVVDVDTRSGFEHGVPRRMFTIPSVVNATGWDLAPDSTRFLFAAPPGDGRTVPFTVVLNWAANLSR